MLGHWTYDGNSDRIAYSNQLAALLDLPKQSSEISIHDFTELLDPHYREGFFDRLLHLAATGQDVDYTARMEGADDQFLAFKIIPELDARGRVVSIFGTAQDITAQQIAEMRMEKAVYNAQEATNAKSRFLAIMSHEIRTPLSGLVGSLNLIDRDALQQTEARYIDLAMTCASRLRVVLNDILDFTRMEGGQLKLKPRAFSLTRLHNELLEFWQPTAKQKDIRLSGDLLIDQTDGFIGDVDRLRQVLDNLVSNAIKFSKPGGDVSVVFDVMMDGSTTIPRFRVVDSGDGIPEEQRGQIFQEFVQLGSQHNLGTEGSGLGLAICKRLITLMDGKIDFGPATPTGTEFWFTVPMEPASEMELQIFNQQHAKPEMIEQGGRELKLLLAEDNATSRLVIEEELKRRGFCVDVVENGQQAVEAAESTDYDVILMDISMPVMGGIEATKVIRDRGDKTPIIALTAYATLDAAEEFLKAGMNNVISKPIEWHDLLKAMSRLVDLSFVEPTSSGVILPQSKATDKRADAIFNRTKLHELLASLSERAIARLRTQVLKDLEGCKEDIETAVETGSNEALEAATHRLQGIAGMIAAEKLVEQAANMNAECRASTGSSILPACGDILAMIDTAIDQFNAEFEAYFQEAASSS